MLYILTPACIVYALLLVWQGVPQNLHRLHRGAYRSNSPQTQTIGQGPVASQEAIKMLGTNGGGFFNANSAHPFENPTPFSNFLQILSIFVIRRGPHLHAGPHDRLAAATAGRCSAAMFVLFAAGFAVCYWAESHPHQHDSRRRSRRALQPRPAATWKAKKCASASPRARSSPPSPPTPVAARSTACTTALRRSAAWFRWPTSCSARWSSAASARACTAC